MGDLLYSLRMHNPSYTKSMEAANEIERLSAELLLERKLSKQQDGLHAGIVKAYEHDCADLRARIAELEYTLAKSASREAALVEAIDCCYRMLISEADTRHALFKAENILRDAIAKIKSKIKEAS